MAGPTYLEPRAWGASSVGVKPKIPTPVRDVFIHHTVTKPTLDPARDAQFVEQIGITRFGRLSYSWMIHPNGTVLEGQGLHRGAHSVDEKSPPAVAKIAEKGYGISRNYDSFGIAAIGDYTQYPPSPEMIDSYVWLIRRLRDQGLLVAGHGVHPHHALKATACPGNLDQHIGEIIERIEEVDDVDKERLELQLRQLEYKSNRNAEVNARQALTINRLQTRVTELEKRQEIGSEDGLEDRVASLERSRAGMKAAL